MPATTDAPTRKIKKENQYDLIVSFDDFSRDDVSVLLLNEEAVKMVRERRIEVGATVLAYDPSVHERVRGVLRRDEEGAYYLKCYLATLENFVVGLEEDRIINDFSVVINKYIEVEISEACGVAAMSLGREAVSDFKRRQEHMIRNRISASFGRIERESEGNPPKRARDKAQLLEDMLMRVHNADGRRCVYAGSEDYGNVIMFSYYVSSLRTGDEETIERYSIKV